MTLTEQARSILQSNDRGGYTLPTAGLYPFQWNWDASVNALGWMTFDAPRAWEELRWLFKGQWRGGPNDGFVAQINFHEESDTYFPGPGEWGTDGAPGTEGLGTRTSSISQPPLHRFFPAPSPFAFPQTQMTVPASTRRIAKCKCRRSLR